MLHLISITLQEGDVFEYLDLLPSMTEVILENSGFQDCDSMMLSEWILNILKDCDKNIWTQCSRIGETCSMCGENRMCTEFWRKRRGPCGKPSVGGRIKLNCILGKLVVRLWIGFCSRIL